MRMNIRDDRKKSGQTSSQETWVNVTSNKGKTNVEKGGGGGSEEGVNKYTKTAVDNDLNQR